MKKIPILAAALLSAALISGHLSAQKSKSRVNLTATQTVNTSATAASGAALANAAAVSTISVRAIKDFRSRFTKVADEQWSHIDKGFCAYCTKDGIKTRVYYDLRGHWQASLKYCYESHLPHFIRDIVKRTYYDLDITFVNIIEVPDHIVYLVHVEDKANLKILRVSEEGEMDVMDKFAKQ